MDDREAQEALAAHLDSAELLEPPPPSSSPALAALIEALFHDAFEVLREQPPHLPRAQVEGLKSLVAPVEYFDAVSTGALMGRLQSVSKMTDTEFAYVRHVFARKTMARLQRLRRLLAKPDATALLDAFKLGMEAAMVTFIKAERNLSIAGAHQRGGQEKGRKKQRARRTARKNDGHVLLVRLADAVAARWVAEGSERVTTANVAMRVSIFLSAGKPPSWLPAALVGEIDRRRRERGTPYTAQTVRTILGKLKWKPSTHRLGAPSSGSPGPGRGGPKT